MAIYGRIVRQATVADAEAIDSIWRQRLEGNSLAEAEPLRQFVRMIEEQDDVFRCWVLEIDGIVCAWVSLAPMRNSPSLRRTMAELSGYVERSVRYRGIGIRLAKLALEHARATPLEWIVAFVGQKNIPTLRGLEHLGFERMDELPPVAKTPNRDCIIIYRYAVGGKAACDESASTNLTDPHCG